MRRVLYAAILMGLGCSSTPSPSCSALLSDRLEIEADCAAEATFVGWVAMDRIADLPAGWPQHPFDPADAVARGCSLRIQCIRSAESEQLRADATCGPSVTRLADALSKEWSGSLASVAVQTPPAPPSVATCETWHFGSEDGGYDTGWCYYQTEAVLTLEPLLP